MRLKYLAYMFFVWSMAMGRAQNQQNIETSAIGTETFASAPCGDPLTGSTVVPAEVLKPMLKYFSQHWTKELRSSIRPPRTAKAMALVEARIVPSGKVETVTLITSRGSSEVIEADLQALHNAKFPAFSGKLNLQFMILRFWLLTNSKCSDYEFSYD